MSSIKICDHCGKKLFAFNKKLFISAGYGPLTLYHYDLCPECAQKFFDWIYDDQNDKKEN